MGREYAALTQCVLYLVLQMTEQRFETPAIDRLDYGDLTGCNALNEEAGITYESGFRSHEDFSNDIWHE